MGYGNYGGSNGYYGGSYGGMFAFLGSIIWLIIILVIASYVLTALAYWKMGKKAGVEWSWVAWIPGGATFVVAKMANWNTWALWPIITLAGVLIAWVPVLNLVYIAAPIFILVQAGQVLESFHYSYAWLILSLVPLVGTIIYLVVLLRIALRPEVQFDAPRARTVFGSPMIWQ